MKFCSKFTQRHKIYIANHYCEVHSPEGDLLHPQKIRVLPAVGLDPESQKKEKIKVSNLLGPNAERCAIDHV